MVTIIKEDTCVVCPTVWSTEPILQHQCFVLIGNVSQPTQANTRFFHCADTAGSIPQGEEGHDPLYKDTQVLTQTLHIHYKAACELTIDDSMIGTKCILHYLLKKPTNGEVQVCADAATAYSTALSIYIGKGDMCWQRLAAIQ